jgi:hypothetical protein
MWRYILTNKNNKNIDGKVNIFLVLTILIFIAISIWIAYSFYNFYFEIKQQPQETDMESYIDNTGFEDVKLKLEQRRN